MAYENLHGLFELFANNNYEESWISHFYSHIWKTCAPTHVHTSPTSSFLPSWLHEVFPTPSLSPSTYLLSEICWSATSWCYEVLHWVSMTKAFWILQSLLTCPMWGHKIGMHLSDVSKKKEVMVNFRTPCLFWVCREQLDVYNTVKLHFYVAARVKQRFYIYK